jgi:transposase
VNRGNVLDLQHFPDTYNQVKSRLKKGSLIVFDKGANTVDNIKLIQEDKMTYLTSMKLNNSDDKIIEKFDLETAQPVDVNSNLLFPIFHGLLFSTSNITLFKKFNKYRIMCMNLRFLYPAFFFL